MKILVTGSAGFIGFHLTNRLLAEGHTVIGLDCINDYYDVRVKYGRLKEAGIDEDKIEYNILVKSTISNYSFIKLNLEDSQNLMKLVHDEKIESVCHLAAQAGVRYSITNPMAYVNSNMIGFQNVIEACRQYHILHLVYASSSSVYGLNENNPFSVDHSVDHPISMYAASKKSNELVAHSYSHLYNLPTTGLRFFTVYGPWGRPDMAVYLFAKAIFENLPIKVFNHGNMERDFTYIDDIVEGIYRVLLKPASPNPNWDPKTPSPDSSSAPYRIYNIGNNNPVKLMDFILAIEKVTNKKAIKEFLPLQPGDVPKTFANVKSLINDFGYSPNTKVEDGIKKFIEWYIDFYSIN